ncbi:polyubiquitin-like [Phalaenopsis equestris]|uniref:polyubiquitin-like n=1 Tax=Phalaenopsis equestris TaxID=78828 RepID=UPI0009E63003|nr:polyubiquitin-like [Phalaenopsis equestris]
MERQPEKSGEQPMKKIKVSFKIIKSLTLEVLSSNTIESIKDKICKIEGTSISQQELFLAGNRLENSKKLSDYIPSTDSTIDVHVEGRMPISIKIPSMEKEFILRLNYMATVQKLKAMIQAEVGISSDQQLLVFCGKALNDDQVLISYGVIKDSTIYVIVNPLAELLLYVYTTSGHSFSLEVKAGNTIKDVKVIVESLIGIPTTHQKIFHSDVELKDSFTLSFYNIKQKAALRLLVPMQIFVKIETGKTITITTEAGDTVGIVITKIVSKMGFKRPNLKLMYAGKLLQQQNTLAFYGIQKDSTIYQS